MIKQDPYWRITSKGLVFIVSLACAEFRFRKLFAKQNILTALISNARTINQSVNYGEITSSRRSGFAIR